MPSGHRHPQTTLIASLSLIALLSACSERHPHPPPPAALQTAQPVENGNAESRDELRATATVAGVGAQYTAHFDDGQLDRIVENREPAGNGEYVFHGARLTKYQGIALNSPAHVELTFDMQSGVTSRGGDLAALTDAEIGAIRNRAELLRSLALARRSTQSHTAEQEAHR